MENARILLVDDETDFTDTMSQLLRTRGYRVTAVNSGESAIEALGQGRYDVMVLDLKMPGMDGMATLKEAKKLELFTETLILTGHATVDTALEAIKLVAYDYLTKPCDIDELVQKIQGASNKKDAVEKQEISKKIDRMVEGKGF
ncbi:MAG: response regulator [Deltaproteobacteria bacterium]|nr:MAG: response regulator [Deltaproteobacteria bacterium]